MQGDHLKSDKFTSNQEVLSNVFQFSGIYSFMIPTTFKCESESADINHFERKTDFWD